MNWKKIGRIILFPHTAVIWLLGPAAAALLAYSFAELGETDAVSIVSYVLSFYALVLIALRTPDIIRFVNRFRRENRYVVRYTSDERLRVKITLYGSFAFSAVYAVFQLGLGLWHRSVWFFAMAGYYLLLAMMRLLLIRHTGRHMPGERQDEEWRRYRLCGVCLLLMNFALGVIITYFVLKIRIFRHHEITTIAMAAYTFASLTMAIRNVIRFRNSASPVYSASKVIALAAAIVSMLTLENAMLTVFGQETGEQFQQMMLGATGVAVIVMIQGMAIYMIVHASRRLRAGRTSCGVPAE